MRFLNLCIRENVLASNAAEMLSAFLLFPEDENSRRQFLLLAEDERRRFIELGRAEWALSPLAKNVLAWAQKKNGRIAVCGYTVLAFFILRERNVELPTLYAATKLVSKSMSIYAKSEHRVMMQLSFEKGEWTVNGIVAPTNPEDIRKAYKEFQVVAHIIAASLVGTEHYVPMTVFERTPETILSLLRTAASIEEAMSDNFSEHFQNPWSIRADLPVSAFEYPPVAIEGNVRAFLEAGLS